MRKLAAAVGVIMSLAGAARAQTAAVLHPAATPQMAGFNAERLRAIDALMQREIDTGQIAGSVVLLVRHGKTILFNAHGRRDLDSPDAMPRDALFRIRSETKPVTGVAMMILYEQGLWGLDDPVTKYVPEFSNLKVIAGTDAAGQPILEPISRSPTMRELMTQAKSPPELDALWSRIERMPFNEAMRVELRRDYESEMNSRFPAKAAGG